jgi:hypothetical protein
LWRLITANIIRKAIVRGNLKPSQETRDEIFKNVTLYYESRGLIPYDGIYAKGVKDERKELSVHSDWDNLPFKD